MYSEHECGICYRTYNAGRRCPRQLHCTHSFCESCLLALARPLGPDKVIVCPLCRHTTSISGEGRRVRAELRVDECVLERLVASGVLEKEEEEDEEEQEEQEGTEEPAAHSETPAEESDFSSGSRGGRLRRSWRKVCRTLSGKSSGRRGRENCMTNEDLRNFAMMSCYMF